MNYARKLVVVWIFMMACSSQAGTYSLTPEYSAGSGANTATIVVDFGTGSYAFNYSWNGTATGWNALSAIDQGSSLDIIPIDYGDMGIYIYALLYQDAAIYNYGMGVTQGWAYFSSENGSDWYRTAGVSFRNLTNGSWDAYVWSNYDFAVSWDPIRQPGEAPIPEPATMMLLGLGGLLLGKRSA
jgi:hypothetical protein